MSKAPGLSIVIPMFNEEEVAASFYQRLQGAVAPLDLDYEIVFVDDGSGDATFEVLADLARRDARVRVIGLSRNFGHQAALLAGLEKASGDYIVMLDGDGQHPPELIPEMMAAARQGYDIVYTLRQGAQGNPFKNLTGRLFYGLFSILSEVPLHPNSADFRLISRRVREVVVSLEERDLFLRGIFAWVGFPSKAIEYNVGPRMAGTSGYSLRRMLTLSGSGITSFSSAPIRIASLALVGLALVAATGYSLYALYVKFILKVAVPGWTSLLILISAYFSGTFILLGIIGEYLARLHGEAKRRPHFIVSREVGEELD